MERRQRVKKDGTETTTPRYVGTAQAGYFRPMEGLLDRHGEIVMYWSRNEKCNINSKAETRLQCKNSINFSSVYLQGLKLGDMRICYGEPPRAERLKGDKQNPFYENRADGFLFLIAPDESVIEVLVVPQGRQLIRGYAAKLADGQLNEDLNELRKAAKSW